MLSRQQASEKAIKAVLRNYDVEFPPRHDLNLLAGLIPDSLSLGQERADLEWLTRWATEARYPGIWEQSTDDDADRAADLARDIVQRVKQVLRR